MAAAIIRWRAGSAPWHDPGRYLDRSLFVFEVV
jgi:hypothetical protein